MISCNFCNYIPKGKQNTKLIQAVKLHELSKHFACRDCDVKFTTKQIMFKHAHESHPRLLNQCNICDYQTVYGHSMKQHKLLQHYICDNCDEKCYSEDNLSQHNATVHNLKSSYDCHSCDFSSIIEKKLKLHIAVIHQEERFQCDNCDKKFKFSSQLITHTKKQHKGNILPTKSKETNDELTIGHKNVIYSKKGFDCCFYEGCGFRFSNRRHLLQHYSTHDEQSND